ncbi:MAG: RNA polymerase sigma factor [Spartobacteria bacterium]|nr:RNA polymerase sigma factor [Spartobacteria bacterium]
MDADSQLIKQAKAGNEMAAEKVLRKYQDRVLGYLYLMLRDFQEAQDATQETFVAALRGLPRYEDRGQFKSWLFGIARHQGSRVLRKRKGFVSLLSDADEDAVRALPDTAWRPPDEDMNTREERGRLYKAIGALPEQERQVLLLRVKGELSFREIAKLLHCPLNTALSRMRTAVHRLKTLMSGDAP